VADQESAQHAARMIGTCVLGLDRPGPAGVIRRCHATTASGL
jgi:hypothetical protein